MAALGGLVLVLVLVLGLLVSAHCEVRPRDPEVEQEEVGLGGGGGGAAFPPHLQRLPPGATEPPPLGGRGSEPTRTGNWCAFVQKRVVTMAVACGTEKYTIKSQSPCPSGSLDCQLVMYKLSLRPVYRQKQQIFSALLWRCCPGHGGENCQDTVAEDPGSSALIGGSEMRTQLHAPGVATPTGVAGFRAALRYDGEGQEEAQPPPGVGGLSTEQVRPRISTISGVQNHQVDPNSEQSDHLSVSDQDLAGYRDNQHNSTRNQAHGRQEPRLPVADELEAPAALPLPHMMALLLSQLQPVLEGFNRSLEHLTRQVGSLSHDVSHLKGLQQAEPPHASEPGAEAARRLEVKLNEALGDIREVRRLMDTQRTDMEARLHSQHAMLHHNLTSATADVDVKLKRHQKLLQVSGRIDPPPHQKHGSPPGAEAPAPPPRQPRVPDRSALWEAVERLDNMVVNNTVKVGGLMEDTEGTAGDVQQLRQKVKELETQVNQTARTSRILFMETGLEVEASREAVLRRVGELGGNLSQQLQEMDVDVDYLYAVLYKQNASAGCGCAGLEAAVARLQGGVANVTELANENRLSLEEAGPWGVAGEWEPAVDVLQRGLQEVTESLASERARTGTLDRDLSRLRTGLADASGLKEANRKLEEDMQRLSGSFNSLLKDAIRHSDVLELLLGEEVLEFLEWPVQDQEAHSIPALKEQLELLQEHGQRMPSVMSNSPERRHGDHGDHGGGEEVPPADQPASSPHLLADDWPPGSARRRSAKGVPVRERQLLRPQGRHTGPGGDGSDLWNLEKRVEQLGLKVLRLQEKHSNTSETEAPPGGREAKLQAEVTWLKRGLEEHLRVFKNVFSNADVLAGSDATLELDKLWQLVKNKDGRKEKRRGGGGVGGGGGGGGGTGRGRGRSHRNRRGSSGVPPLLTGQSEAPLLFAARSPLTVSDGAIRFAASTQAGRFYSDTGTFRAPANGIYLFVVTLDLEPGPAHLLLRRGSGGASASVREQEGAAEGGPVTGTSLLQLREGEGVSLELKGGVRAESEDNLFVVLLLHQTT
ncbi:multimerin-2a [Brachionichthys hirsutus]|uniref:multimerin-2a n=1 Tax=Brachionichthys hirsutus TaxID=412623 RepID=UPI003604EB47